MYRIRRYNHFHNGRIYRVTMTYNENGLGISVCSPKDQFSRKVGRELAVSRLESKPYIFPVNLFELNWEVLEAITYSIVGRDYLKNY